MSINKIELNIYETEELFNHGRNISIAENVINQIKKIFNLIFPIFKRIFDSPSDHFTHTRQILSFLASFIYSIIIFNLTISQIENLPDTLRTISFLLILIVVTIGMTFNESSRCLMSLSTFNFITSSFKVLLTTYIMTNLLNGPINTTMNNVVSLTNSFQCQLEFSRNLSKEIKSIDAKKKQEMNKVLIESQGEMNELNEDTNEMNEAVDDYVSEDFDDSISN